MERTRLTITLLRKLEPGTERKIADTEVRNLQVWVGRLTITFYLVRKFEGRQRFINLGRWPDKTLDEARNEALAKLGAIANHQDINAPSGRAQPTVGEAMDAYLDSHTNENTRQTAASAFRCFAGIRNLRISQVTRADVQKVHEAMADRPGMANVAVKCLSAAMSETMKRLNKEFHNPVDGFTYYEQIPRKRYLTIDEAPRFIQAVADLQNSKYGVEADAVMMMLYTGARKNNVCEMMLEEIGSNGIWTIPKTKFKGGFKSHEIQLGTQELEIIERRRYGRTQGPVFLLRNRPLRDVRHVVRMACQAANIADFHPHDLRRNLGTWMLSTGADIAIVSKKLGHMSIKITEQVYAHILPDVSRKATDTAIAAMESGLEGGK
jgi:integrase